MEMQDQFASEAHSADEIPEPLRHVVREHLSSYLAIRCLSFNPPFVTLEVRSPGTVLAVTDDRWFIFADSAEGTVTTTECGFDDTLLVEQTSILLHGQLKIDFIADDQSRSIVIDFSTVMEKLYHEAVDLILAGIEGERAVSSGVSRRAVNVPETWPLALRNAIPHTLTRNQRLLALTRWDTVYGGFKREIAPAAALLATDRELVLVSEEKAWPSLPHLAKYGFVTTYFPLARLAAIHFDRQERFSVLDLEMHASHGGEKLKILFPSGKEDEIARLVTSWKTA